MAGGVPNPESAPESIAGRVAQEPTHDVYVGLRGGKAAYVGISNNRACRTAQHGDRLDAFMSLTNSRVTRDQAKGIEQALINNNAQFENATNSIASNRPWYDQAVFYGQQFLSNTGF